MTKFIKKIVFLAVWVVLVFGNCLTGQGLAASSEENLKKAAEATRNNDIKKAQAYFHKAAKSAQKDNNWKALLDTGYSFLAIGDNESAYSCFSAACQSAKTDNGWASVLAVGYAYMSIHDLDSADSQFEEAYQRALETKETYGLIEIAKAFRDSGKLPLVEACLNQAKTFAKLEENTDALFTIALAFHQQGLVESYDLTLRDIDTIKKNFVEIPPPPDGWKAYGESIAEPEKPSAESQDKNWQIANHIIEEKYRLIARKNQEALQAKERSQRFTAYYMPYTPAYSYPPNLQSYLSWDILRTYYVLHGLHHLLH